MLKVNDKDKPDKWKYRRRIAFLSFGAILIVLFTWLFGIVTVDKIFVDAILYIVGGLIMIILAYQGVATLDDLGSQHIKRQGRDDFFNSNQNEDRYGYENEGIQENWFRRRQDEPTIGNDRYSDG